MEKKENNNFIVWVDEINDKELLEKIRKINGLCEGFADDWIIEYHKHKKNKKGKKR